MKKLLTLLLAAGMVVSAANGASAADIKVSGEWWTSFSFTDNLFGKTALVEDSKDGTGSFNAAQRVRINFDIIASESLSGRVQLQVADGTTAPLYQTWGTEGVGGAGKTVTARLAYLDWMIPTTDVLVRMGRQVVAMPSYTFGSPIMNDPVDAIMVNAPINDMVSVNVGWLRASAMLNKWDVAHEPHSSADFAYLSVDVAGDGFKVTPWGMLGLVGNDVSGSYVDDPVAGKKYEGNPGKTNMFGYGNPDENATVYWVGLGGELTMFDPFKFTADFMYSGNDADGYAKREGWYAALGAEMKLSMATPFLRGWYASGDDADSKKSGQMLSMYGAGVFDGSAIYYHANGWLAATIDRKNPWGTWGVQLGVKDVSFIEDLTHRLSVTYAQGTNNTNRLTSSAWKETGITGPSTADVKYMTTADSMWEIDFITSYKLYKNLTANILLAYMIPDFDESIRTEKFDNGFRGTLNFAYTF